MTYPSEIEQMSEELALKNRMQLYLDSNSIEEYIVERDVKFPLKNVPSWCDELVWWYVYNEKYSAFLGWNIASMFAFIGIWLMVSFLLGLSLWCIIPVTIVILFLHIVEIQAFNCMMTRFGQTTWRNTSYRHTFKDEDKDRSNTLSRQMVKASNMAY